MTISLATRPGFLRNCSMLWRILTSVRSGSEGGTVSGGCPGVKRAAASSHGAGTAFKTEIRKPKTEIRNLKSEMQSGPVAWSIGELKLPLGSIQSSVRYQVLVHDRRPKSRRTFGPSGDATNHQWFSPQRYPHGTRFPSPGVSRRPTAVPSDPRAPSGRQRAPLASQTPGGHFQRFAARRSCLEQPTGIEQKQRICFTSAFRKTGPARRGAENILFQNWTRCRPFRLPRVPVSCVTAPCFGGYLLRFAAAQRAERSLEAAPCAKVGGR